MLSRRQHLAALAALLAAGRVHAQGDALKIGVILPMTGPIASTGRQIDAAIKLFMAQNGAKVAGRKLEVIVRDDAGVPDTTRRLAQELVVNDKVAVIAGFGLTPCALAAAPIATQSKTPLVVMAAGTSSITEASPFVTRTSVTLPQVAVGMAEWSNKNGIKKVVTLVADYGPGIDAEKYYADRVTLNGGSVLDRLRTPLRSPDFAPVLQRVRDTKPDALFVFLPSGQGTQFMKQFAERGLDKLGVRLIGSGEITDDDQIAEIGDVALGIVTAHHYSAAHPSAMNKKFVADFQAMHKFRPNFMAVGGWDGMRLISKALEATKGGGGEALMAAMKGQVWESPRGPVYIDAQTRDIVLDMYIRKVERVNGELWNIEFDAIKEMKDPGKSK
jgi:branched-chain amino acid transport system substrate-binding protein